MERAVTYYQYFVNYWANWPKSTKQKYETLEEAFEKVPFLFKYEKEIGKFKENQEEFYKVGIITLVNQLLEIRCGLEGEKSTIYPHSSSSFKDEFMSSLERFDISAKEGMQEIFKNLESDKYNGNIEELRAEALEILGFDYDQDIITEIDDETREYLKLRKGLPTCEEVEKAKQDLEKRRINTDSIPCEQLERARKSLRERRVVVEDLDSVDRMASREKSFETKIAEYLYYGERYRLLAHYCPLPNAYYCKDVLLPELKIPALVTTAEEIVASYEGREVTKDKDKGKTKKLVK